MILNNEEAKAVQEISKTTGKGIDLISQIGECISGPVKEGMGILQDNITFKRWENRIKIAEKVKIKQEELGFDYKIKQIEFKLAVPLFEAATLDEDDYMQELWANLLINSSYEESGINLCRAYIDTLERLSPYDAKILLKIYKLNREDDENGDHKIATYKLPREAFFEKPDKINKIENIELILALTNLHKLNCIIPIKTFGMDDVYEYVNKSVYGKHFIKSCTLNF